MKTKIFLLVTAGAGAITLPGFCSALRVNGLINSRLLATMGLA